MDTGCVNPAATFADFLQCWCRTRQQVLVRKQQSEQDALEMTDYNDAQRKDLISQHAKQTREQELETQQWAYYWCWHATNWYDTLQYIMPKTIPSMDWQSRSEWWTWDPTPTSADEANVDDVIWATQLDPSKKHWEKYANICSQFAKSSLLESVETHMGAQICYICLGTVSNVFLYNALQSEVQLLKNIDGNTNESINTFISKITTPGNAHNTFVNNMANHLQVHEDCIEKALPILVADPAKFWKDGYLLQSKCGHYIHGHCLDQMNMVVNAEAELNDFVMLPRVFVPFTCGVCRAAVTHISIPGVSQQRKLPNPNEMYNMHSSASTAGYGPYWLQEGALVWVMDIGASFGGAYGGYLGKLVRYEKPHANTPDSPLGTFVVQQVGTSDPPTQVDVTQVFDISFFELDFIPTRDDLELYKVRQSALTKGLDPNYMVIGKQFFITTTLGSGDIITGNLEFAQHLNERAKQLTKIFENLPGVFANELKHHRSHTESRIVNMVAAGRPRMSAAQLLRKIAHHSGFYRHEPKLRCHFHGFDIRNLTKFSSAWAKLEIPRVPVHGMSFMLFAAFASAGFDVLPQYSEKLFPFVRRVFSDFPAQVRQIAPMPDGPITNLINNLESFIGNQHNLNSPPSGSSAYTRDKPAPIPRKRQKTLVTSLHAATLPNNTGNTVSRKRKTTPEAKTHQKRMAPSTTTALGTSASSAPLASSSAIRPKATTPKRKKIDSNQYFSAPAAIGASASSASLASSSAIRPKATTPKRKKIDSNHYFSAPAAASENVLAENLNKIAARITEIFPSVQLSQGQMHEMASALHDQLDRYKLEINPLHQMMPTTQNEIQSLFANQFLP